jgi:hypothetical protein
VVEEGDAGRDLRRAGLELQLEGHVGRATRRSSDLSG